MKIVREPETEGEVDQRNFINLLIRCLIHEGSSTLIKDKSKDPSNVSWLFIETKKVESKSIYQMLWCWQLGFICYLFCLLTHFCLLSRVKSGIQAGLLTIRVSWRCGCRSKLTLVSGRLSTKCCLAIPLDDSVGTTVSPPLRRSPCPQVKIWVVLSKSRQWFPEASLGGKESQSIRTWFTVVLYMRMVLWSRMALGLSIGLLSLERGGKEAGVGGGSPL